MRFTVLIALFFSLVAVVAGSLRKAASRESEIEQSMSLLVNENSQLTAELQLIVQKENYEQAAMYKKLIAANAEKLTELSKSLWEERVVGLVDPLNVPDKLVTTKDAKDERARIEDRLASLRNLSGALSGLGYAHLIARVQQAILDNKTIKERLEKRIAELTAVELEAHQKSARKIADPSYYQSKSREYHRQAVDNFLQPHQEFTLIGRSELSDILEDASSQGVQNVKFWSKLSEAGYITLALLNAGKIFEDFVLRLSNMDSNEFGKLFAANNAAVIASFGTQQNVVSCTFKTLMHTGECMCNDKPFSVAEYDMFASGGQKCKFFTTAKKISIEESEDNLYNNVKLLATQGPNRNWQESTTREYLYNHRDVDHMFHFIVSFDGKPQPKYSEPGQGVHLSKILHWEITHKQLFYELVERNFTVTRHDLSYAWKPNAPLATNHTAFAGYSNHLSSEYHNLFMEEQYRREPYKQGGVLNAQVIELRLWNYLVDDLPTLVHSRTLQSGPLASGSLQTCILC